VSNCGSGTGNDRGIEQLLISRYIYIVPGFQAVTNQPNKILIQVNLSQMLKNFALVYDSKRRKVEEKKSPLIYLFFNHKITQSELPEKLNTDHF
jgi:hypothetical protein